MNIVRDCHYWIFCWCCWRAYTWGPWSVFRGVVGNLVLPHAGMYAYSPTWSHFRETVAQNRADRMRGHA